MTAHDDAKIAEILGYSAEVCEPDSKPITAYYTSRHLDPVRNRLVEYVESVRADERERIAQAIEANARDLWTLGTDWVTVTARIARGEQP